MRTSAACSPCQTRGYTIVTLELALATTLTGFRHSAGAELLVDSSLVDDEV